MVVADLTVVAIVVAAAAAAAADQSGWFCAVRGSILVICHLLYSRPRVHIHYGIRQNCTAKLFPMPFWAV